MTRNNKLTYTLASRWFYSLLYDDAHFQAWKFWTVCVDISRWTVY